MTTTARRRRSAGTGTESGDAPGLDVVLDLAASLGLKPRAPRILSSRRGKSVIHLRPEPVVARVVTLSSFGVEDVAQLHAQVSVARHLRDSGQPVVPLAPVPDPGPHHWAGLHVTFWAFADRANGDSGRDAGVALRAIHRALETYPRELRSVFDLIDVRVGRAIERLRPRERDRLRRSAERVFASVGTTAWGTQPLHGDAHLGNVLRFERKLVWNDLEHTCHGPREWDVACLAVTTAVLGRDRVSTGRALKGYGEAFDNTALDTLIDLRVLEFAALKALDTRVDRGGLDFWLTALEERLGRRRAVRPAPRDGEVSSP